MKGIRKSDYESMKQTESDLNDKIALHNHHLQQIEAVINKAIKGYMNEHGEAVNSNIDEINLLQESLGNKAQEQIDAIDSYMQERSETWHDSKAASDMNDWYEDWVSYTNSLCDYLESYPFDCFEFDPFEIVELPRKDRK